MTQTHSPAQVFPDSAERNLRAMLAALDDALAAIADAREELRGLYTGPRTYPEELELFSRRRSPQPGHHHPPRRRSPRYPCRARDPSAPPRTRRCRTHRRHSVTHTHKVTATADMRLPENLNEQRKGELAWPPH